MLKEAMPALDKVRFVNSGTEAVMTTIRVARAYTGTHKNYEIRWLLPWTF